MVSVYGVLLSSVTLQVVERLALMACMHAIWLFKKQTVWIFCVCVCVSGSLFTFSWIASIFKTQIHTVTWTSLHAVQFVGSCSYSLRERKATFSLYMDSFQKNQGVVSKAILSFQLERLRIFLLVSVGGDQQGGKRANSKQQALSPFFKIVLCDLDYHGHKTQMHKVLEIFYLLITSAFKDLTSSKLMLSRFHFNKN